MVRDHRPVSTVARTVECFVTTGKTIPTRESCHDRYSVFLELSEQAERRLC